MVCSTADATQRNGTMTQIPQREKEQSEGGEISNPFVKNVRVQISLGKKDGLNR